nr:MAG: hypothetical protein DIU73_03635 [Actinomycetota bacterium]
MSTNVPAGWHPDPKPGAPAGQLRYWDGTAWTEHVHPAADAGARGADAEETAADAGAVAPRPEPDALDVATVVSPSAAAQAVEPAEASEASPTSEPSQAAEPAQAASSSAPANWYPDPLDPASGRLRYWDGSQWTDHYHPSGPASARRERKPLSPAAKRWLLGSVAAVTVIGVGVTGVVLVREANRLPECDTLLSTPAADVPAERALHAEVICTDSTTGYDYTAPLHGIEQRDVLFQFDAKVSQDSPPAELGIAPEQRNRWGITAYADAGLTIELPVVVYDDPAGQGWLVDSLERSHYQVIYSDDDPRAAQTEHGYETIQMRDNVVYAPDGETPTMGQWGFRDTYYLVRTVDADGRLLERPVVSEVSFAHELETPQVAYGMDPDSPGTLKLSWREVEGAAVYVIFKASNATKNGSVVGLRDYQVLGYTDQHSWSADEALMSGLNEGWHDFYRTRQNASLELYRYSDDSSLSADDFEGYDADDFEYGVVALGRDDDGDIVASAFAGTNARDIAGHNVHQIAENAFVEAYGGNTYFGVPFEDIDDVPTTVPIVSLDGRLRDHTAVLLPGTVLDASHELGPGWYQVGLFAAGTRLGVRTLLHADEGENILTLIDEFNERSASEAPPTGNIYSTMSLFEIDDAVILETAPAVDFPVFGTHAFVQFLGQHMVARSEAVDLGPWMDQPGRPEVIDAVLEAMDQNPYQYVMDFSLRGDILYLKYAYGPEEYRRHQEELRQNVQAAVQQAVKPGMTDRQKAKAINDYLVRQADYDHRAVEVTDRWSYAATGQTWREYAVEHGVIHAWEANGAWSPGVFVCYGYAMAFTAMAREAGLDVMTVTGPMTTVGGSHAWNKVHVDGAWYGVDVTWNDAPTTNQLLFVRDSEWGSTRYFAEYAARAEDSNWVLDANQPNYATP